MYYPEDVVEEVRTRNDIVDVISGYVKLQKKGANYFGLCPFHNEKSPSFSVSPQKQMYYCFGCGAGGNAITFIMEYENYTFPEALKVLADRAGVHLPEIEYSREERAKADKRSTLLEINKLAANYFYYQLHQPQGKLGYDYFRKRELSDETIRRFGLGFANKTSNDLYQYLRSKGYTDEILRDSGLVTMEERGTYDKFWNRVMFPIMDVNNRVIGFGGRVMGDGTPKYLNSPETEIFNKRKNLFALNAAKKSKLGYLILVEGYMDAIALHQYGFDCAVASLGTSLTEEHANILAKYTNQVILTYDGDEAGQNATRRAIPMLEKTGIQVRVLRMQGAKDPDEFLKKYGAQRFEVLLDSCQNQAEYRLDSLRRKFDLTLDEQRVEFLSQAAALIASFPNAVQREIYGRRAAEAAGITPEAMQLEVKKAYRKSRAIEKRKREAQELDIARQRAPKIRAIHYDNLRSATAEEGLICMLLREPELIAGVKLPAEACSVDLFGRVLTQLRQRVQSGRPVSLAAMEGDFTPEEMSHLSYILSKDTSPVSDEALADYLRVIQEEYEGRTRARSEDSLRLLAEQKRSTKQYGG